MAYSHPSCGSQHADDSEGRRKCFDMLENGDKPCDVTLMVKDGKQFKAHRNVLSKASFLFEKMLDSDWKESRERVIRLDMLTEGVMEDILEFIYSGFVGLQSVARAEDLITAADYLVLPNLKVIAGQFLGRSLSTSNSISIYHFAERFQCEELLANTRKFIHSNFASVANEEDFLNLPSHEVEQWIASDDIHVSAEDDVFKIILKWIDHDKTERKKRFQNLFRHMRLSFVCRDFLADDVLMNDLVKQDDVCVECVTRTLKGMSPRDHLASRNSSTQCPRKVFQTEVLVACQSNERNRVVFSVYLPDEDKWYRLPDMPQLDQGLRIYEPIMPFGDKLIVFGKSLWCYDPFFNYWTKLANWEEPEGKLTFAIGPDFESYGSGTKVTVVGRKIFAVVTERLGRREKTDLRSTALLKYNLDSDSWENVPSFDWGPRESVCVVSSEKYLFAIGGRSISESWRSLTEAARFDIIKHKWEKIADIQEARSAAFGVATHQNIFIAGGCPSLDVLVRIHGSASNNGILQTCEMYNMSTNEWQFIGHLTFPRESSASMVCVGGTLYVLGGCDRGSASEQVECYDRETNEWKRKTFVPERYPSSISACSLRIFKGVLNNLQETPWWGEGNGELAKLFWGFV